MSKPVARAALVASVLVLSACGTATAPGSGGGTGGSASPPGSASGTALRRVSASGGYPGKASARAVFQAEGPGRAVLLPADDIACLHSHPACLVAQRAWQVTVIVVPAQ